METYLLLIIVTLVLEFTLPTLSVNDKYFEDQYQPVNKNGHGNVQAFTKSLHHITVLDSRRNLNKRKIMKTTSMTPQYPENIESSSMKTDVQTPKSTTASVTMDHPSHILVPLYLPMLESKYQQVKPLKENALQIYSLNAEMAETNRDLPTYYNTPKYTLVQATPLFPPADRKVFVSPIRYSHSLQPLSTQSTLQSTRKLYPKKPTLVPLTPLPTFKTLFFPDVLNPNKVPTTVLVPVTSDRTDFKKIIHVPLGMKPLPHTHSHKNKKSNISSTKGKMNRPLYPINVHSRKPNSRTNTALEPTSI